MTILTRNDIANCDDVNGDNRAAYQELIGRVCTLDGDGDNNDDRGQQNLRKVVDVQVFRLAAIQRWRLSLKTSTPQNLSATDRCFIDCHTIPEGMVHSVVHLI